jgi:hypothetical protein
MSYFFSPNSGADLSGYVQTININTIAGLNSVVTDATVATVSEIIPDGSGARTLVLTDAGKYIRFTAVGGVTLTIPTHSGSISPQSVAFPIGTEIYFRRGSSAGAITLSNAGVTINGGASIADIEQNDNFALKKVDTDEWDFI